MTIMISGNSTIPAFLNDRRDIAGRNPFDKLAMALEYRHRHPL